MNHVSAEELLVTGHIRTSYCNLFMNLFPRHTAHLTLNNNQSIKFDYCRVNDHLLFLRTAKFNQFNDYVVWNLTSLRRSVC